MIQIATHLGCFLLGVFVGLGIVAFHSDYENMHQKRFDEITNKGNK